MAGNRNSGRKPAPPTAEDAHSEKLVDLLDLVGKFEDAEAEKARRDFQHRANQRHRIHEMCQTIAGLANGWRDLRGLYPPDQRMAEVIPFPAQTGRGPEPSEPMHQAVA